MRRGFDGLPCSDYLPKSANAGEYYAQLFYYDTTFNPMIDPIKVVRKKILQKWAGSLNNNMPTSTVPTAPIPVQTAYAVPIGIVWLARYNRYILIDRLIKKPVNQRVATAPEDSFAFPRQVAKATSNNPAIISIIQFIVLKLIYHKQGEELFF